MMTKRSLTLLSLSALLSSCGGISTSASTPNSNKESENEEIGSTSAAISEESKSKSEESSLSSEEAKSSQNPSESEKESAEELSLIFSFPSVHDSSSEAESSSPIPSSSGKSEASSSSEESVKEITEQAALDALALAYGHDDELSVADLYTLTLKDTNGYTQRKGKGYAYKDGTLHVEGEIKQTDFINPLITQYIEEKSYEDGELFTVRKYDSIFLNQSSLIEAKESEAALLCSLGQAFSAYGTISSLKEKQDLSFYGYEENDGSIYGSYNYVDDSDYIDKFGNIYCIGVEFHVDKNGYLDDFFYAEGMFEYSYWNYEPDRLRSHGPQGEAFFYEATNFVYGEKVNKTAAFPKKDNLLENIEWKQSEVTLLSSSYPDGYIFLPELVQGGVSGFDNVPLNNLLFTVEEGSFTIADGQYLMLNGKGDVRVSAADNLTKAVSKETLLIHVE